MFIDETTIEIKAGDGGNGCFSYEKLKYKPKGKPDGGNGGRGGSIFVVGSKQIHTLQDVAYRKHYKAERGAHGKGKNQVGKSAEDIIIPIPLGTIIYDESGNEIMLDCINEGQKELVAEGGRGGRGNAALAYFRNPNPDHCEPGKPGEEKKLRLVLKVLADVGLVGRPNAGKSTFLSRISHARPKIADYPFTTKEPNLGIVRNESGPFGSSYVVADIPGLIEDCHKGKGMGIQFLRHIERTSVLAIMVEASSEDPAADADILLNELKHYSEHLAAKPKCFILTKTDILSGDDTKSIPEGWLGISAVTGDGVSGVLREIEKILVNQAQNATNAPAGTIEYTENG
ncbi:MAG: GTPase ObgE [Chitinispirillia bacterium]|nr:GTPase ObgE [Chitinispirillia bacterium]MCL2268171.1 GTPase ObgE [Chitinispirillia bacterium]